LAQRLTDETAHLHDRDLVWDKPGRVFDHAPPATGRRGSVGHHGTGGERSPRKHEAESFARTIVAELAKARNAGEFDRLVLLAGPAFLGLLRDALPKTLERVIAAQVNKDLVHQSEAAITAHLLGATCNSFPGQVKGSRHRFGVFGLAQANQGDKELR